MAAVDWRRGGPGRKRGPVNISKGRGHVVRVTVPQDLLEVVDAAAEEAGVTRAAWFRMAARLRLMMAAVK